ncbi:MAG: hypothetical protein HY898_24645 [Deltaproteobacteria bacterium]|nr:hypothetical protein [Deltaproteobacteria bacterium]
MPDIPNRIRRGPVTLVVSRDEVGGPNLLSWTFANEEGAMLVARAFRKDERWLLIRGIYSNVTQAIEAARDGALVVNQNRPSGLLRRCDVPRDDKERSSA